MTLLAVSDLKVHFPVEKGFLIKREVGRIRAVDGVSLELERGGVLGLVGESGCGKSTTARAIIGLVPVTEGSVKFQGDELTGLRPYQFRPIRRHVQMVFQDPYASLDPRLTVGAIVAEPLRNYEFKRAEAQKRVLELLDLVGLARSYAERYPHEFSGGQRQRIGIARALALSPTLLVLDEPVSALDVSIQAQIVNLLVELKARLNLAYLFIAHDLAVVRHISDRVAVMYLGEIAELASRDTLYARPLHPYTQALLSAVPVPDPEVESQRKRILLEGDVPSPDREVVGCKFASRCPLRARADSAGRCEKERPPLRPLPTVPGESEHKVACHYAELSLGETPPGAIVPAEIE
ncbi:ATP-binding cassette domain-containing protein [bacterium]|nr:ATP-binding cassette domain-containing protein [bacterium]